jgi:DNA-binding Lrp family transcriptional regulator
MEALSQLDAIDRRILRALQGDGRMTYDVLASVVSLSPLAVLRRVKRLEESGVIAAYVALVAPERVGLGLTAYLNVRLEKHSEVQKRNPMDLFRAAVQTWPEVVECAAADRRDGLPAARGGAGHGALLALRHGHAAQAPERAGLQDQFRARPGEEHHRRAAVTDQ